MDASKTSQRCSLRRRRGRKMRGQVRLLGEVESGWRMTERKAKTKEEGAVAAREHMYA